eukprot:4373179-Prymnesium_polylepis.1
MQEELAATGRKMVTIVDPHIKKDPNYKVYQEAHDKGLFINTKDGSEVRRRAAPPPHPTPHSWMAGAGPHVTPRDHT